MAYAVLLMPNFSRGLKCALIKAGESVNRNQSKWLVAFMLLVAVLVGCAEERKVMPVAKDGVIDLTDWDFEKDGNVFLFGEWRFVWNEFVSPMKVDDYWQKYPDILNVPTNWRIQGSNGAPVLAQGFATYVLKVKLPKKVRNLVSN